ncbi:MAG: hypothetical protein U0L52_01930 [Bacteroidaceae bacterium]|nr:hypothetical protein [Bacteroidaceae bacterium]
METDERRRQTGLHIRGARAKARTIRNAIRRGGDVKNQIEEGDEVLIYPSETMMRMFENGISADDAVAELSAKLETQEQKRLAEYIIRKFWEKWSEE